MCDVEETKAYFQSVTTIVGIRAFASSLLMPVQFALLQVFKCLIFSSFNQQLEKMFSFQLSNQQENYSKEYCLFCVQVLVYKDKLFSQKLDDTLLPRKMVLSFRHNTGIRQRNRQQLFSRNTYMYKLMSENLYHRSIKVSSWKKCIFFFFSS